MQKLKIVVLEKNDDNQNGVSNYLKNCDKYVYRNIYHLTIHKCTTPWHYIHSQHCATITTVYTPKVSLSPTKTLNPLKNNSPLLPPCSPWKEATTNLLYGSAYSGYFI